MSRGSNVGLCFARTKIERRDGGIDRAIEMLARIANAEQADERRLSRRCVLTGRLADIGRAAFGIEKIIADLKCRAEMLAIGLERCPVTWFGAPENSPPSRTPP